jgi:hypothetical protein
MNRLKLLFSMLALSVCLPMIVSAVNKQQGLPTVIFKQIDNNLPIPEMEAVLVQNENDDYTAVFSVKNFVFLDMCTNDDYGKRIIGHVHVYDGVKKLGTAYRPEFFMGKLEKGQHEFTFILQAPDHRSYIGKNGMIYKKIIIDI